MHQTSYNEMLAAIASHMDGRYGEPLAVLDVGSRRVQRGAPTYRSLMPPAWTYTGCDTTPGDNVDLVQLGEYRIRQEAGLYDVVISGQCLEHVRHPWLLAAEMARMLKPGGWALWTAPWIWHYHPHPIDCWRILPDGMKALMESAGLTCLRAYRVEKDCWGIGRKLSPADPSPRPPSIRSTPSAPSIPSTPSTSFLPWEGLP